MDENEQLVRIIKQASFPMTPAVPPPLPPEWELSTFLSAAFSSSPIRAVLFDVYGTLFCSAAGDISLGDKESGGAAGENLDALAREYDPVLSGEDLREYFKRRVAALHREQGGLYPEVQVDEIWMEFLREHGCPSGAVYGRELALRYELAVNPVYPMPGAGETIAALAASHCMLGIISNAQFFTPLLFEAFLGGLPEKIGFDPALLFYSFEMGEAKPSGRLFNAASGALASLGIKPEQCLFVGNDMFTDVWGAQTACKGDSGFLTCLFAGDGRSLRLREGDERIGDIRPSCVIHRLQDIPRLIFSADMPKIK
ncbi:MAG: HAD family hydrolase [Treponema sp.]|jgi:putative hydrolase of the HAD superfamily|nr:HAD family hydrolase [Treponema sp.]